MRVSVLIPTYNSAATIRTTLESVIAQTYPPNEIIVLDDGSVDATCSIVRAHAPRVILHQQKNHGVAYARNVLCKLEKGDLLAFLDHDDLWHPRYLETQCALFERYPHAGGLFTGHINFAENNPCEWPCDLSELSDRVDVIDSLDFFVRYNKATGPFASMSYLCLPGNTLRDLHTEPFRISGVDDSYLCCQIALTGRSIVYCHTPLVAYRLSPNAQSHDKLKAFGLWVEVFQTLDSYYCRAADSRIKDAFRVAFAAKRRYYAKLLMGAGRFSEARSQLCLSLRNSFAPTSLGKSLGMLALTFLPHQLQPEWPAAHREWTIPQSN